MSGTHDLLVETHQNVNIQGALSFTRTQKMADQETIQYILCSD